MLIRKVCATLSSSFQPILLRIQSRQMPRLWLRPRHLTVVIVPRTIHDMPLWHHTDTRFRWIRVVCEERPHEHVFSDGTNIKIGKLRAGVRTHAVLCREDEDKSSNW